MLIGLRHLSVFTGYSCTAAYSAEPKSDKDLIIGF